MRGLWITDSRGSNTLARFDPSPAGVQRGGGGSTVFWTQRYFCPPVSPPLQDSEGLVSCSGCQPGGTRSHHPDRRAPRRTHALGLPHLFGLHRPLSNLAGDERSFFFLMHHSYVSAGNWVPAAISLLFWNGFQMWTQAEVVKHFLNWSHRWKSFLKKNFVRHLFLTLLFYEPFSKNFN